MIKGFCVLVTFLFFSMMASAAGLPDFAVTSITLNPQVPAYGGTFSATVTITNQGAAGNADYLYIYTNRPASVSFGTSPSANTYIGAMTAGERRVVVITGLSSGLEGARIFRALVNARGLTAESELIDDQAALAYNVAKKPDLLVSSIAFDPSLPSTGAVFAARVVLKNAGQIAATNIHVSAWVDRAAVAVDNTGEDAGADVVYLGAGQSVTNVFGSLGGGVVVTARTFRVFVDSSLALDELAEANNQLTAAYRPAAHADYSVNSIVLAPSVPQAGETFSAAVTVTNSGGVAGGACYLYVYTNKPLPVATMATGDGRLVVNALGAGQSAQYVFSGLQAGTEGVKFFRAFVDSRDQLVEVIETNNQSSLIYTVNRKTDVVVTGVTMSPVSPFRGGVFSSVVTLRNDGVVVASNVLVSAWADKAVVATNGAGADASLNFGNIPVGASVSRTFENIAAGTGSVSRVLRVFADPGNALDEGDETNNQLTRTYSSTPIPDFAVASIIVSPSIPVCGSNFAVFVTVTNRGFLAGDAGYLYVYTNRPSPVTATIPPDATVSVGVLDPGEGRTFSIGGFEAEMQGSKTFRAFVDAQNRTTELTETNNQATQVYTIRRRADLQIIGITFNPATPFRGGKFDATVTVMNSGWTDASNVLISVWADMSTPATNNIGADASANVGTIPVGGRLSYAFTNMDAGTGMVRRVFRAFANSDRSVDEDIMLNNQLTKSYVPVSLPDFSISSIQLNPAQPLQGMTFTAYVTVTNQGYATGRGWYLYVYTNKPSPVVAGTAGSSLALAGYIVTGQIQRLTIPNLKAGMSGTKTFRAFIDALNQVVEMSETNNQAALSYDVITKPDVRVTAATLSPVRPSRGGVFNATVTVKNEGSAPASNVMVSAWADLALPAVTNTGADQSVSAGTIGTNASVTTTFTGLDAWTGTVTRTFRVFADSNLQLDEISENNNQMAVAYTPVSRPDFVIMSLNLSTTNPPVSSNFTANVTVKNIGYAAGNAGYVDVWLNKATNLVAAAATAGDKHQLAGTLVTNQVKILTFTGLNAGTNLLPRVFRAFVDSRATTIEIIETNNQATVDYVVGP